VVRAPAGERLQRRIVLHLGVERPAQLADARVKRDEPLVLRAQVQHIAELDRRDFERGFDRIVLALDIAGAEGPRDAQVLRVPRCVIWVSGE